MDTIVNYAVLSDTLVIKTKEDKAQVSKLYARTNWQKSTLSAPLSEILMMDKLITIKTDNVTVIDFDSDEVFEDALAFNSALHEDLQCQLIVKSIRKGGHFYYLPDDSIELPLGHTKQSILDILTTIKHNALAPTPNEQGKQIIHKGPGLTRYNTAINTFVALHVMQNIPQTARAMTLNDGKSRSDDAKDFVKGYLANIVSQQSFDQFYNIPIPIPPGMSNQMYLNLSTRLGTDETISKDDYLEVMTKFNQHHQRKSLTELTNEITQRMLSGTNGLWRYDKDKQTATFTATHKRYKTQISAFFDIADGSYIIHYLDSQGTARLHTVKNTAAYAELMEKISNISKQNLRDKTKSVAVVDTISDYTKKAGYNHEESTYNKAFINTYLTAFAGTKPTLYSDQRVEKFIELLKFMWGEEYDYLLDITKHRYSTFQYSPVVTFLQGTEGSGKDITIDILTKGFTEFPQALNYQLMKDKHSNWQIGDNAIFSEVGSWKAMERDDMLAELKTISGSNGKVTFRDMQKTAQVVQTYIKIWITGNEWFKVHSDPLTQRRIHIVYMPRPLNVESGGPYTSSDLEALLSEDSLVDFYYWLGNIYRTSDGFGPDKYISPISRQKSEAYQLYLEDVESSSDRVSGLIYNRTYDDLLRALKIYNLTIDDVETKYNRENNMVVTMHSLKQAFAQAQGGDIIAKTLNRISATQEGGKRLHFSKPNRVVERYITFFGAPQNVGVEEIEGVDID